MTPRTISVGDRDAPVFPSDAGWDAAQTALLETALSDGLPCVVPTRERLAAMLAGRDPQLSSGAMPPLFGELTAEAVAYCCVLSGAAPAAFPVVLEAAVATLEPTFNLLGIQTTTGTPTAAVLVHGPAVERLGMNAGPQFPGPGHPAPPRPCPPVPRGQPRTPRAPPPRG